MTEEFVDYLCLEKSNTGVVIFHSIPFNLFSQYSL